MSWRITHPPEYHLNLSGGGSDVNVSRYFITFSSMDGGHAVASEDIQLLADDEVIIESQIYDSPNLAEWTWFISGNTSADTRIAIISQTSLQANNVNLLTVDGVDASYDGSSWSIESDQTNLRTVVAKVAGNGIVRNVGARWDGSGSPDCIIARIAIKRAGQIIHDWIFDVDNSTDVIADKAGSNITFSLINVLPEMRQKYEWSDAYNGWLKFGDTRPYYFFSFRQHALAGDVNIVAGQRVRFKCFNISSEFTLVSRAENSELVHIAGGNIYTSWTVSSATLDGEPLISGTPAPNDDLHHEIEVVLGANTAIYAIGGDVRNFAGLGGVVYDFAVDDGSVYSFALDDTDGIARNSGSGADGAYVGSPRFINFMGVAK